MLVYDARLRSLDILLEGKLSPLQNNSGVPHSGVPWPELLVRLEDVPTPKEWIKWAVAGP